MQSLVLTFAVILVSLCVGYGVQVAHSRDMLFVGRDLLVLRRRMQSCALFFCMPLSAMLSLWGLPSPKPIYALFPLLGLLTWVTGSLSGLAVARLLGLNRAQSGSVFCCASLSNIAGIGGLVCVLFLGEQSIALVALYRMFEEFYYFGLIYPVARFFGEQHPPVSIATALCRLARDKVIGLILLSLSLGLSLNLLGIPRPTACGYFAAGIMVFATMLFLSAIGMSLRISRMGLYTRQWIGVSCCKFVCVPLCVGTVAWLCGFGAVENALPLKVVVILSTMPVAMNALVPPTLFGLDVDLANTCWLGTTAALVVVLPLIMLVLGAL